MTLLKPKRSSRDLLGAPLFFTSLRQTAPGHYGSHTKYSNTILNDDTIARNYHRRYSREAQLNNLFTPTWFVMPHYRSHFLGIGLAYTKGTQTFLVAREKIIGKIIKKFLFKKCRRSWNKRLLEEPFFVPLFGWVHIFQTRKTANLIELFKSSLKWNFPLDIISQIEFFRNMSERWSEMVSAGHQGLNPNSFIFKQLRVAFHLYNVSNVRAQVNLPRITLEQNKIDLLE